jgi:hypothetical protein
VFIGIAGVLGLLGINVLGQIIILVFVLRLNRAVMLGVSAVDTLCGVAGIAILGIETRLLFPPAFIAQHMGEMIVLDGADIGQIQLRRVGGHMIVW